MGWRASRRLGAGERDQMRCLLGAIQLFGLRPDGLAMDQRRLQALLHEALAYPADSRAADLQSVGDPCVGPGFTGSISGEAPCSALSRTRAWVSCRAGALPRAINRSSPSHSSSVNLTGFFLFLATETPPRVRSTVTTRRSGHEHNTRAGALGQTNHV